MEQEESRPRTPSLLADPESTGSGSAEEETVTGEAGVSNGQAAGSIRPGATRRRRVVAGLLVVALIVALAIVYAALHGPHGTSEQVRTSGSEGTVAPDAEALDDSARNDVAHVRTGSAKGHVDGATPRDSQQASIGDSQPFVALSTSASMAESASVASSASSSATTTSADDLIAALDGESQPRSDEHRPRAEGRASTHAPTRDFADADVEVLASLLSHVSDDGNQTVASRDTRRSTSIAEKMRACPAADTSEGVRCRKRICDRADHASSQCPEPSEDDAATDAVEDEVIDASPEPETAFPGLSSD